MAANVYVCRAITREKLIMKGLDEMKLYEVIIGLVMLAVLVATVLFMSGCTTIRKGDFVYQSTIFDKKVDELVVVVDANGTVKSVMMKNYNSDMTTFVEGLKTLSEVAK